MESRRSNLVFFWLAIVFSLLIFGGAGYLVYLAAGGSADGVGPEASLCEEALKIQGVSVSVDVDGNRIHGIRRGTNKIESVVEKVSVAMAFCPGLEIESFCAGEKCSSPGLSFSLIRTP